MEPACAHTCLMSNDSHWINTPPKVDSRRPLGARLAAVAVVLTMAFGGGIIGGIIGSSLDSSNGAGSSPLITAAPINPVDIGNTNIAQAAGVIAPSVVTISSDSGTGTGIIVSADGEVLTNQHVIDGADEVQVRLFGATSPITADVLAEDESNDLALLKLRNQSGLTPAVFADPESIAVGDPVVAVGYALALDGGPSVTSGIISALNRTLQLDSEVFLNALIQTDAAISSGNSGGPLINLRGEVVGVNTAVANGGFNSSANNIGFAIGVAEVTRVAEILRATKDGVSRPQGFLGISLGSRNDGGSGAVIGEVTSGSPAAVAGLEVGDIVLEINDQPITGDTSLVAIIRDSAPGDEVEIVVERDGVMRTLTATLTARERQ
jgi:S1-C subfamily serine protease